MSRPPVTLAVVNARIRTGDPRRPWADGLAVAGDRIAALGSSAEIRKLAGAFATARVIDARGRLLTAAGAAGAIERGGVADFVLIDHDRTPAPPSMTADEARVLMRVVGGSVVFEEP